MVEVRDSGVREPGRHLGKVVKEMEEGAMRE